MSDQKGLKGERDFVPLPVNLTGRSNLPPLSLKNKLKGDGISSPPRPLRRTRLLAPTADFHNALAGVNCSILCAGRGGQSDYP